MADFHKLYFKGRTLIESVFWHRAVSMRFLQPLSTFQTEFIATVSTSIYAKCYDIEAVSIVFAGHV